MQGQNKYSNFSTTFLSQDNGLSQGSNYYRYEDSLGFVWITGNDAVNRYDGNFVKVYNKDFYFENCKNLQQGYGFAEDNNQNIYIGSPNGLYVYKRKKDKFNLKFLLPNGNDQTIFPIGFSDGKIWCHNKDYSIISYNLKTNKSTVFVTNNSYKVNSFHVYDTRENPIFCRLPFLDTEKNIWIVNPNEVLFFNTKTNAYQGFLKQYFSKNKIKIYASCYDEFTNCILFGTNIGVLAFNCKTKEINIKIKTSNIYIIAANKDIIVTKTKEKLSIYNKSSTLLHSQKLTNNFITSYTYSFDKMNRLWMCGDGFGQIILDFNPPLLNKVTKTSKLFPSGVGRFSEFSDGEILVNDSIIFNKKTGKLTALNTINKDATLFVKNEADFANKLIWQVFQNKDESVNLFQIDNAKKQKLYCKFSKQLKFGLLQDALLIKNDILCSFQSGLYIINLKLKSIKKLANQTKINAFKINPISGNRILVSYLNQEATVYQLNEKNEISASKNILQNYQPFYFEENIKNKQIWAGTNNGVLVLDENFKLIKKIDANNNIAGTYIYGILLDNEGNCWASHQRGLSYINSKNYNVINFTKEDGIQEWDFNNRAYFKASDGTLFFGGMNGFNYFKPPVQINNKVYQSKVYIDEILINQEKIPNAINNDFINLLKLKYSENNISIHAIVRNIYRGNQFKIVYRINNSNWIFKDSDCTIDLVNLAPKNYKLQLGVYDKFENKIKIQKNISILISAPFYQLPIFWIANTFLILTLLFYYLYYKKTERQKNDFTQQLVLEKQRSKITADLHDEIGSTLSSLQLNAAVANAYLEKNINTSKKILEIIENQSQLLSSKISDIIWSMKPGKDEFMSFSTRIKNYCNEVLGSTDINYSINIDAKIDSLIIDISDRKNTLLITKEAINNALKYSKASEIKIEIRYENNIISLLVSDNGIGFNPNEVVGNGIGNMKKRANDLNGTFQITSNKNSGTTIQLQFKAIP